VRLSEKDIDTEGEKIERNSVLFAAVADALRDVGRGSSSGTCKAYFSTLLLLPLSWKINCSSSSSNSSRQDNSARTYEPSLNKDLAKTPAERRW